MSTPQQLSFLNDPKEPLQIRIPATAKRRFKAAAAMRGLEPNELFMEVWEHYERTHAGEPHHDGDGRGRAG